MADTVLNITACRRLPVLSGALPDSGPDQTSASVRRLSALATRTAFNPSHGTSRRPASTRAQVGPPYGATASTTLRASCCCGCGVSAPGDSSCAAPCQLWDSESPSGWCPVGSSDMACVMDESSSPSVLIRVGEATHREVTAARI
jgi:hypothetical protein